VTLPDGTIRKGIKRYVDFRIVQSRSLFGNHIACWIVQSRSHATHILASKLYNQEACKNAKNQTVLLILHSSTTQINQQKTTQPHKNLTFTRLDASILNGGAKHFNPSNKNANTTHLQRRSTCWRDGWTKNCAGRTMYVEGCSVGWRGWRVVLGFKF